MKRVYNFSAGPAMLPSPVLKKISKELDNFKGLGYGLMETSHRSPEVKNLFKRVEDKVLHLCQLKKTHRVLFLQGGATQQFIQIPENLSSLSNQQNKSIAFIHTGAWTEKAIKMAGKFNKIHILWNGESENFNQVPNDLKVNGKNYSYLHLCSNNTIFGTQYKIFPHVNDCPSVIDMSSDIFCREMDYKAFDLIFAGSQKNLGPAGLCLVIISHKLLKESTHQHDLFNYHLQATNDSMINTPPVFPVYVLDNVLNWLIEDVGGLKGIEKINNDKAEVLYRVLDEEEFYLPHAKKDSRSLMNITFNLKEKNREDEFNRKAIEKGLVHLKGHRSVGGFRASIYNAMPLAGVEKLAKFLKNFP